MFQENQLIPNKNWYWKEPEVDLNDEIHYNQEIFYY